MAMTPELWTSLTFFVAGLVGTGCRAAVSQSQTTFSRKTVADLVIGGLTGIVYPMVAPIPIPAHANLIQQAAFVALVSYFVDHLLQNVLGPQIERLTGGKV